MPTSTQLRKPTLLASRSVVENPTRQCSDDVWCAVIAANINCATELTLASITAQTDTDVPRTNLNQINAGRHLVRKHTANAHLVRKHTANSPVRFGRAVSPFGTGLSHQCRTFFFQGASRPMPSHILKFFQRTNARVHFFLCGDASK